VAIQLVGVVGAGTMGTGIAEVFARAGLATTIVDHDRHALVSARERIHASLDRAEAAGRLHAPAADIAGRIHYTGSLRALEDRDLVLEAIVESEAAKAELLAALGGICRRDAILASNSSSIPIVRLAHATVRPRRVLGVHFFNPAPVQPLVEVVGSIATDPNVIDEVVAWCRESLGKHVVRSADRAGFMVSTLLIPFLLSAIRMLESGLATAHEIDEAMRFACAHSMGPLALSDLMGLDTVKSVADVLFDEYGESQFAAPDLLERMVDTGMLGRKSGEGFFHYAEAS
jgi:3-hydroxybutyryl-CoA dehydrogenase